MGYKKIKEYERKELLAKTEQNTVAQDNTYLTDLIQTRNIQSNIN